MKPFDPAHLLAFGVNTVLWGGNHYADKLPASSAWLVWDKRDGDRRNDFADCEFAWCSGGGVARVFRHLWMGYARASERDEKRQHPTQKPVEVIKWSIVERTTQDDIIADFYSGSGTTLIACEQLSRRCRAVEISPSYVAVALERWATSTGKTPVLLE